MLLPSYRYRDRAEDFLRRFFRVSSSRPSTTSSIKAAVFELERTPAIVLSMSSGVLPLVSAAVALVITVVLLALEENRLVSQAVVAFLDTDNLPR